MVMNKKVIIIFGIVIVMFGAVCVSINTYISYTYFVKVTNIFIQMGFFILISFLTAVILRYLGFLWFSFLNTFSITKDKIEIPKQYPKISIIVPAYNEEKTIAASIKSMLDLDYPKYEIVVIDDGSKDKTYEVANSFSGKHGNVTVRVFTKSNGGKANALNYGITHSESSIVMCVDADSRLQKDVLWRMVKHLFDPNVAAVAGAVKIVNTQNLITKLQQLEYIEGLNLSRSGQGFLRAVNIIPGPIGMFKKSALEEVGFYDHDTFAEDCDLTLKLITAGFNVAYEPDAVAWTEAPEDVISLIKQRYRWTRGILQAIRKHSHILWHLKKSNKIAFFTLWYMQFEGILWPFMDTFANVFLIFVALTYGLSLVVVSWWVLLTIVDAAAALFCLLLTGESLLYMFYVPIYRLFYITFLNIVKVFATIEEWFQLDMTWGKLERKGRI